MVAGVGSSVAARSRRYGPERVGELVVFVRREGERHRFGDMRQRGWRPGGADDRRGAVWVLEDPSEREGGSAHAAGVGLGPQPVDGVVGCSREELVVALGSEREPCAV